MNINKLKKEYIGKKILTVISLDKTAQEMKA